MKSVSTVKWNTISRLRGTKLPDGYKIEVMSSAPNLLEMFLWNGNKRAGNLGMEFALYGPNRDKILAIFEGGTQPNYRGKSLGTLLRALLTKAALNSGVNEIHHNGININSISARSIAARQGIPLNNAKKVATPLSTRIVRKLGYEPTTGNASRMSKNMNRTKLNNAIKKITAAINIQRAYRRYRVRGRGNNTLSRK